MVRFCEECGAELKEGASFCAKCGATVAQAPTPAQPTQQPVQPTTPPIQDYGQTQAYPPMQPRKSKKGLIIALLAIVIIVVLVLAVFFLVIGTADGRFVGQWEQDMGYGEMTMTWDFQSNGKLKVGTAGMMIEIGSWSVEGNKLCLEVSSTVSGLPKGKSCVDFEFSNNGNTLTLTQAGIPQVLTKK